MKSGRRTAIVTVQLRIAGRRSSCTGQRPGARRRSRKPAGGPAWPAAECRRRQASSAPAWRTCRAAPRARARWREAAPASRNHDGGAQARRCHLAGRYAVQAPAWRCLPGVPVMARTTVVFKTSGERHRPRHGLRVVQYGPRAATVEISSAWCGMVSADGAAAPALRCSSTPGTRTCKAVAERARTARLAFEARPVG